MNTIDSKVYDILEISHRIQKHVLNVLIHQKYARFRDMRAKNVDTNLYSYHLKLLQKRGFVVKSDKGYSLGINGLLYADRVSKESVAIRRQPIIVTMMVIQNSNGDVLLLKRRHEPFLDRWTLPYAKLRIEDMSVTDAALRGLHSKLGLAHATGLQKAGDCYIRITSEDTVMVSTLAHVFYLETDEIALTPDLAWARPHKLADYELAPAVEQIITRTFFRDPYFFEEYSEKLV
jgi:ADP-ribose pyrophosphatase YjhB (NUDIX family)